MPRATEIPIATNQIAAPREGATPFSAAVKAYAPPVSHTHAHTHYSNAPLPKASARYVCWVARRWAGLGLGFWAGRRAHVGATLAPTVIWWGHAAPPGGGAARPSGGLVRVSRFRFASEVCVGGRWVGSTRSAEALGAHVAFTFSH